MQLPGAPPGSPLGSVCPWAADGDRHSPVPMSSAPGAGGPAPVPPTNWGHQEEPSLVRRSGRVQAVGISQGGCKENCRDGYWKSHTL